MDEEQATSTHKIGSGHFAAMVRLGGHELTSALAAFPDSNIRPQEEAGIFGNPTPQIVTQEMGSMLDEAASAGKYLNRSNELER